MSNWIAAIALVATLLPSGGLMGQDSPIEGCEGRVVDRLAYDVTLSIIRYRVDARYPIEQLLILSSGSDPDVLGIIATDENLRLAEREVAANAILDQLFIADPYFQACAAKYLDTLSKSPERSLRLKAAVGSAIMEHWLFITEGGSQGKRPKPLELHYAAMRESDVETKAAMRELAVSDPVELVGSAALPLLAESDEPYRMFDSIPLPVRNEATNNEGLIDTAWSVHRAAIQLSETLAEGGESAAEVFAELDKASPLQVRAFLTRFRATMLAQGLEVVDYEPLIKFFKNAVLWSRDPYFRSLALVLVTTGHDATTLDFLFERLTYDKSMLFRLAAADIVRNRCVDPNVRQRLMASFREEKEAIVKLRMLHSLAWPFGDRPPPDVQAFLLGRLRDQEDTRLLCYVVALLGSARVHSAAEPLAALARRAGDPLLRERIGEALRSIRGRDR